MVLVGLERDREARGHPRRLGLDRPLWVQYGAGRVSRAAISARRSGRASR
jgi:hypothetical protein